MSISQASQGTSTAPSTASTRPESLSPQRLLIAIGFAIGAVLGFGGNFAPTGTAQNIAYAISSLGLLMGSVLIAARFARQGHDIVAAGFALLALAEGINMTSMFEEFTAGFAAGTAVYVVALLLASLPPALPLWVRILGTLAVIPFAAHATLFLLGQNPAPSGFFASVGYAVLTLTVIGWIISVLRATPAAQQ